MKLGTFINFLPASLPQENEKTGSIIGPGRGQQSSLLWKRIVNIVIFL